VEAHGASVVVVMRVGSGWSSVMKVELLGELFGSLRQRPPKTSFVEQTVDGMKGNRASESLLFDEVPM
jgi:hypothetical protein